MAKLRSKDYQRLVDRLEDEKVKHENIGQDERFRETALMFINYYDQLIKLIKEMDREVQYETR